VRVDKGDGFQVGLDAHAERCGTGEGGQEEGECQPGRTVEPEWHVLPIRPVSELHGKVKIGWRVSLENDWPGGAARRVRSG